MSEIATSPRSRWIIYTVLRLALFGAVFAVLMLVGLDLWLAGMAAAIIALCIAYVFIPQPKRAPRPERPDVDAEVEDAVVEQTIGEPPVIEQAEVGSTAEHESDAAAEHSTAGSEGDRRREPQAEQQG